VEGTGTPRRPTTRKIRLCLCAENSDERLRGRDPRLLGRGTLLEPGAADARSARDEHGADSQPHAT